MRMMVSNMRPVEIASAPYKKHTLNSVKCYAENTDYIFCKPNSPNSTAIFHLLNMVNTSLHAI